MNLEETKVKARSIFKRVLWVLFIAFVLCTVTYYFYRTYTLSEGTRSGMLFKISKKGKVFKTYEGQIQLAGAALMNKQSIWEFSVVDATVYGEMQAMEGKNVRLHYKEVVHAFPWQGETNYLVYDAEEAK
ncbi:MAG: hypothetical protein IPN29_13865 [Saprospiraceae bacterium]|nr:hypothetical protein [Saprospiraceae bacterium]